MVAARKSRPKPPVAYGESKLDYQEYLKVPQLLDLQIPQSRPPHHDEYLFIIIHQAYELWFKLILHELDESMEHLRRGRLDRANHFLHRVVEVMRLLVQQIHLLETMTPVEFLAFRDRLKPASGFQSQQFREIEFAVGLKDPSYLKYFDGRPALRKRLEDRLAKDDLGSALLAHLRTRGLRVPTPATATQLHDDPVVYGAVARALLPFYKQPSRDPALYAFLESMLQLDETFQLWREHHVRVVERIIGAKQGTGGSSGVPYLRTTLNKRCFPFLWELRTHLEA